MEFKDRLWTISSRLPKSKRFFQLGFEGFRPRGRNKIEHFLYTLSDFGKFFALYLKKKVRKTLLFTTKSITLAISHTFLLKPFLTRKLIWSRGKLARPITTAIIMSVAFLVFTFGKLLSGSKFVNTQEVDPDYLASVSDIIPQRNITLTTIPEDRKRSEPFDYTVVSGDTLYSIGEKFKISTDAIRYINNLSEGSVLSVGQSITIPPVTGLIHTVKSGDTLNSIANKYDVAPQAIADFNYIIDISSLAVGSELVIPGGKVPEPVAAAPLPTTPVPGAPITPPPGVSASKGWCLWPSSVRIVTQYFSWYHNGLDIATPHNIALPPLYACADGVVTRAGWDPYGLGLHVRIDHGNGFETVYGHMSRIDVGYGERLDRGKIIGLMGNTGNSTGPHVHFIVYYNGIAQDPMLHVN